MAEAVYKKFREELFQGLRQLALSYYQSGMPLEEIHQTFGFPLNMLQDIINDANLSAKT